MIFLRNILFVGIFFATIVILVTTMGAEPPSDEAQVFLNKLQEGDTPALLTQFGENSCHCQPRGGYIAYLKYESGENDNLAFLFGHKFKTGTMNSRPVPTIQKEKGSYMPWESPESWQVDIPITFEKAVYAPRLLPLDTAFGIPINESDLQAFCKDPANDIWKGLPLRLRPSLQKGVVEAPLPKDPKRKPVFTADYFLEVLKGQVPDEEMRYLRPLDAGIVLNADKKPVPQADVEKQLPLLKRGILRLYIGRRGQFQRWAVKKGRLKDPVFELADGQEVGFATPAAALVDQQGPAASVSGEDGSTAKSDSN